MWSRQWSFGSCQKMAPGHYSCHLQIPKSCDVVSIGAKIFYRTEKHVPVTSLRIRIENEESHEIQIQGISPSVLLKPGESHDFTVTAGLATKGVDGAYICAFNTAARVKLDIFSENLEGAKIKISGSVGCGP